MFPTTPTMVLGAVLASSCAFGDGGGHQLPDAAVADAGARPADAAEPPDSPPPPPDADEWPWRPGNVPGLHSLSFGCKLINGRNQDDPTANRTHTRANLRGTDLGIPVAHGSELYVFFGDTAGAQVIWPLGPESLPDAVGYAATGRAAVTADPSVLCSELRFLVTSGAHGSVAADFAGAYMAPPAGHDISEFIHYHVDQRFDASGPLRGDFINIAALVDGDYVYLYGTGAYRASSVHLARKRLDTLDTAGGFERFDAASSTWVAANAAAAPIVTEPDLGEVSVRYFPEVGRYVMLDQEVNLGNRIAARFAEAPEGPWSPAVTVATMSDPLFAARYCCLGTDCPGERMFECDHAGFYGTYMLPDARLDPDGNLSISFLVSTWIPYNVALMTATFR